MLQFILKQNEIIVNYINNSYETLIWQKRKFPLVGVKPNASHLPDEHPRLLDHRGFPDLP